MLGELLMGAVILSARAATRAMMTNVARAVADVAW